MTVVKVQIAPELLNKLEARAYETIGGRWDIPLTPPEVVVLVDAYRERDALAAEIEKLPPDESDTWDVARVTCGDYGSGRMRFINQEWDRAEAEYLEQW